MSTQASANNNSIGTCSSNASKHPGLVASKPASTTQQTSIEVKEAAK